MKRPGFLKGVVLAAVLGFGASVLAAALLPLAGPGLTARLLIPALGLAYLVWLFGQSDARSGRVTVLVSWGVLAALLFALQVPLPGYLLAHAGALWFVRALYAYDGVLPAVADLLLTAFATLAAAWALARTDSVFMAAWCFFLVQAFWVSIPPSLRTPRHADIADDPFDRARHAAEAAIRQLVSR